MLAALRASYGETLSPVDALAAIYTTDACDERRQHVHDCVAAGAGPSAARLLRWQQSASQQLVYGEFDLELFSKLLEAARPSMQETFCDLGSGAGRLVLAAALLHPQLWKICIGLEVLSEHHEKARAAAKALALHEPPPSLAPVSFVCADIFDDDEALRVLPTVDVLMAYSITWAAENGTLTALSALLGATLRDGARVITVELRLQSTPRMLFTLVHAQTGWNEETGQTTGFVYRASVRREPVVPVEEIEEIEKEEQMRLVPHVYVTVSRRLRLELEVASRLCVGKQARAG